jgi:hypothetical protein
LLALPSTRLFATLETSRFGAVAELSE